jgi:hypothetical protein
MRAPGSGDVGLRLKDLDEEGNQVMRCPSSLFELVDVCEEKAGTIASQFGVRAVIGPVSAYARSSA